MFNKLHIFDVEPEVNQNLGRKSKSKADYLISLSCTSHAFWQRRSRIRHICGKKGPPDQSLRPSIWPGQVSRASFDCVCVLLKRRSCLMTHLIHGAGTDGETCTWSNGRILGTIMHHCFWWKLIFVANQGIWLIFYSADAKLCSRVKIWNIHWFRTTRASQNRTDAVLVIMMMTLTKMMVWNDDDDWWWLMCLFGGGRKSALLLLSSWSASQVS